MHQPRARLARTAALMFWVRRWRLSPGTIIAIIAYVMVAVFGAAMAAALLIPAYGAKFVPQGDAIIPILNGRSYPALIGTPPITIANRTADITVPASTLVPDDMAPGTPAQIRGWYRDRSRIAEVARGEAATISFRSATGAVSAPLAPQRRGIVDLPLDFWLLTLEAVLVGILGLWVRANRPRELSSWLFGSACDGILLAAMSGAVFDSRELTARRADWRALLDRMFEPLEIAPSTRSVERPPTSRWRGSTRCCCRLCLSSHYTLVEN